MAKWLELSIRTTPEYVEPLVELFRRHGGGSVVVQEEGDWDPDNDPNALGPPTSVEVKTYLPMDATVRSRREMIDIGVRLVSLLQPMGPLQERVLEEQEWETAWKAHFTLMRIGRRLVIKPTWQEYTPTAGEAVVDLDPGMAFGTGHHPTTRMCLEFLEERVTPGARVLDVGTGSGILAIAAAKLGAASVLGVDIDPAAATVAQVNARQNGVAGIVKAIAGSLPNADVARHGYNIVVANITAKTIVDVAHPLAQAVAEGGVVVVSGILRDREPEVEEAFVKESLKVIESRHDGDWVALVAELAGR